MKRPALLCGLVVICVGVAIVAGRLSTASAATIACPSGGLSGSYKGTVTLTTDCFVAPSSSMVIDKNLAVASGARLLLDEHATLTVGKNLEVAGVLQFRSDSTLHVGGNAEIFGSVDLRGAPTLGVLIDVGKNLVFHRGSSAEDTLGGNEIRAGHNLTVDRASVFRLKTVALSVGKNLVVSRLSGGELWIQGDNVGGATSLRQNSVAFIVVFGSFGRNVALDGNSTGFGTSVSGAIAGSLTLLDNTDTPSLPSSSPGIRVDGTVGKNLVCKGNSPPPQLSSSLVVAGRASGQCAPPRP